MSWGKRTVFPGNQQGNHGEMILWLLTPVGIRDHPLTPSNTNWGTNTEQWPDSPNQPHKHRTTHWCQHLPLRTLSTASKMSSLKPLRCGYFSQMTEKKSLEDVMLVLDLKKTLMYFKMASSLISHPCIFLCTWVWAMQTLLDSLKLESQAIVSYWMTALRAKLGFSARIARTLNLWVPPDSICGLFFKRLEGL